MSLDPIVFIIIGAVSAAVSVTTAVLTLRAEHRRLTNEKRDEQARRNAQRPNAITKSQSIIHFQELDASIVHHT